MDLPPRYLAERWVADGGMASVWCATDKLLDRKVAIKLLSARFADDEPSIARFKREARAAARLSGHPNVVATYDVGQTGEGNPFIVMEYLTGGSVADALRVGEVDRRLALSWISQAAAALDYAHVHGVVHRDIKPANLLLDGRRDLRVADFGIAHLNTEETLTGRDLILGTAAYLSPEQALGAAATDASDRYSLAVVAYELLVGTRPFNAEPVAAQARQHVETPPPRASRRNRTLPGAVDPVLARGLAKRPEDRWPTAAAFAQALTRACEGRTVTWMPWAHHGSVGVMRRRAAALAALAAAGFTIGVASGASHSSQKGHAARSEASLALHVSHRHHARPAAPRKPAAKPATSTGTTQTATPAADTTPAPTADTLEARGHALMVQGDYAAAIPLLHQALATADPSSLTYAYALFDLGRSLRLSGDPRAAIPVLYQRLQIPVETEIVRQELQLALQAVGLTAMHGGGHPGHGHGHGHGHGPGGGD